MKPLGSVPWGSVSHCTKANSWCVLREPCRSWSLPFRFWKLGDLLSHKTHEEMDPLPGTYQSIRVLTSRSISVVWVMWKRSLLKKKKRREPNRKNHLLPLEMYFIPMSVADPTAKWPAQPFLLSWELPTEGAATPTLCETPQNYGVCRGCLPSPTQP